MPSRKVSVRRLFRKDPYNKNSTTGIFATGATTAIMSPVADQFTDNPNVLYDPSKAPGAVSEVSVAASRKAANKPGKARRGHQKAFAPNVQTLFGGKRLRRR
jgi:hypothetical protein